MRIALISDIHGNLVSLEAVLDDIDKSQVDQIICLGDVVTTGPQPHEVVVRLKRLNCPGVTGNHDSSLLESELIQARHQSRWAETLDWCEQQLSNRDLNYLRSFQSWIKVPLDKTHNLLCFHGSPKANTDFILPTTPDDELRAMLEGHTATLMVGGHTHVQMLRRTRDSLIVNAGSVGLPFDRYLPKETEKRVVPWAEYAIITRATGGLSVDFRRIPIDFEAVKQATAASGNPYNWLSCWFTPDERSDNF